MRAALTAAVLLALAGPAAAQTAAPDAAAADPAAGERVYVQCRACHQVGEAARNGVGPALNGLFGRKAGTVPAFAYTEANRNSGIVWDEPVFGEYIRDPKAKIPGTRMVFPGLRNDKQVADLTAYLRQFGPDGKKAAP